MNINTNKYPNGSIYLSGGMEMKKDLGAGWRLLSSAKLKSIGFYPIDITALDRSYANDHCELFYSYDSKFSKQEMLQFKSNIRKHFIDTDLKLVDQDSDALIVLWDQSAQLGGGTHNEISHAAANDIPIFIMTTVPKSKIPGWILSQVTKVFTKWDALYKYLNQLPVGILKRDQYGNHHSGSCYLCSLCGDAFEKGKHHFVSKISPLYCSPCVDLISITHEDHPDRYEYMIRHMAEDK